MRINLNCPFEEKDEAKRLGAHWDVARKVWYIVDVEDLTPFMRWIDRTAVPAHASKPGAAHGLLLGDYLTLAYPNGTRALSAKAAHAFGIPYPLPSGWPETFAGRTIPMDVAAQLLIDRHSTIAPSVQVASPAQAKKQRRKAARQQKKASAASKATAARQMAMLDQSSRLHIASLVH